MRFNPDQVLRCGCIVATHTKTGNPVWNGTCAIAEMLKQVMANAEGNAWAQAAGHLRAHVKVNGLR